MTAIKYYSGDSAPFRFTLAGASVYNSIVVYGQTDSGYVKHVLTSSGDRNQSLFFTSSTPDFKKIYFNGALELVYQIILNSNIPWNSKQKVYWMINARISSTNTLKRYVNYSILL